MLALVLTFLIAVYILGPDLISRWVLGFVVPRKNIVQTKSEEVTRAVLWAIVPLLIAYYWAAYFGKLHLCAGWSEVQTCFSGIYSETFFNQHRSEFFRALSATAWLNWCILWRLYLLVLIGSVALNLIISNYGYIRHKLGKGKWLRSSLAFIVLPRISEWHVLLSGILLPSKQLRIYVDVLTKSGLMYRGILEDKTLTSDGTLLNIILAEPMRFKREQFQNERKNNPDVKAEDYWKEIPGNVFVLLTTDITSLNLRYTQTTMNEYVGSAEIVEALSRIRERLEQINLTTKNAADPN